MRFTNSNDKIRRTEVRIAFRLSLDDITNILCFYVSIYGTPANRLTHKDLKQIIQCILSDYGNSRYYSWMEDCPEYEQKSIKDFATKEVERLIKIE